MTHPLEQLAGFVDGTLGSLERAAVDEHVRSCARCRDQVAMAAAARAALRALPEPDAPDLASSFTPDRVTALTSGTSARSPWSKIAPAIAAAAVVALVALVVPRLGSSTGDAAVSADGAMEASSTTGGPLRLELDNTDYDEAGLEEAATSFAASFARGEAAGSTELGPDAASGPVQDQTRFAGPAPARAFACLEQAFPGFPGEVVQMKQARFEGVPAFLGVVLESPGAVTPPNTLSIWVAAIEDCSILSITSARL